MKKIYRECEVRCWGMPAPCCDVRICLPVAATVVTMYIFCFV